jgi:hypothetical protein
MPTIVKQAAVGSLGFDVDVQLTATTAAALRAAGLTFALRYLSIGDPDNNADLTLAEAQIILGSGLALMAVQHVRYPGWQPTEAMGTADGTHAAANAAAAGLPAGICVWCDLEGIAGTDAVTIAYTNAWAETVQAAGYLPGVYIGDGVPLTSAQLYQTLSVSHYWRSQSQVANVDERGYQVIQLYPETLVAGVSIDFDVIQKDFKGDLPAWVEST